MKAMPFLDRFKAFRANRWLHYQIQNAAICCILFASVAACFSGWQNDPNLETALQTVAVIALLVLAAKFLFQPKVICYVPEVYMEYVKGNLRKEIVRFPRLYVAHTGSPSVFSVRVKYHCLLMLFRGSIKSIKQSITC